MNNNNININERLLLKALYYFNKRPLPNSKMPPQINNTLSEEEKKNYLEDNDALAKLLTSCDSRIILDLISSLDSTIELDNKLKRKILLDKSNLKIVLKKVITSIDLIRLMQSFNVENEEDFLIKKELFKDNFELLQIEFSEDLNRFFSVKNDRDIKLKRELLLTPPYRDIILRKNSLFIHLALDLEDENDKEILSDFFLTDDHIEAIKTAIYPGCLFKFLEKFKTVNPFSIQIKRKVLLNKDILIAAIKKLYPDQIVQIYNSLDTENETDKEIILKMFTDDECLFAIFERLMQPHSSWKPFGKFSIKSSIQEDNLYTFLRHLNTYNEVNTKIKRKIFLDTKFLKILSEQGNVLDLLINSDIHIKENLSILKEIISSEEKLNIVMSNCDNIYSFIVSLQFKGIMEKNEIFQLLKRKIILSGIIPKDSEVDAASNIIFRCMDLKIDYNCDILKELLFNSDGNIERLKYFGLPALFAILNMTDKQSELYQKVKKMVLTDDAFIDNILAMNAEKNLPNIIRNINLKNEMVCILLKKIICSEHFLKKMQENSAEQKKVLYEFIRSLLRKLNVDNYSTMLVATLDQIIVNFEINDYEKKQLNEKLDSPDGSRKIYEFSRGIIEIAPNGDQIKINIDKETVQETRNNQVLPPKENKDLKHHDISIKTALLLLGYSAEELIKVPNHPFDASMYGVRKGSLTVQIEGDSTIIYFPKEITKFQYDRIITFLNEMSEYEKKEKAIMKIKIVIGEDTFIDNMLLHDNVFTSEVMYIIKKEKILKEYIENEKQDEISKMLSEQNVATTDNPVAKI